MSTFKDFIPEGEPLDGQGGSSSFTDFVPEKEPEVKEEIHNDEHKCSECDFTSKSKAGLASHERTHKE